MIDETAVIDETTRILEQGEPEHGFRWDVIFHFPDEDPFNVLKVEQIVFYGEYTVSLGERVKLTCMIPKGFYVKHFVPNRQHLVVQIRQVPVFYSTKAEDPDREVIEYFYKAIPEDIEDIELEANSPTLNEEDLNRQGILSYNFECIHPAVFYINAALIGTMHRNEVPGKLLEILLNQVKDGLPLDVDYRIKGISMVPPDNQNLRSQFMISHRTRVKDLHRHIQSREGGVYSCGISSFILRDQWYVFPPFNTGRFEDENRKLVLVNLPPNRMTGIETTFGMVDDVVVVLLTNKTQVHDDSELSELNLGNGLMYLDTSKVIDGFATSDGNRARISVEDHLVRYGSHLREDGHNYAPFSDEPATSNHYSQASKLARRHGIHLEVLWENSDPSLVYPGMPVRVIYTDGEELDISEERDGVLIGAEHDISSPQQGMSTTPPATNSYLTLFLNNTV